MKYTKKCEMCHKIFPKSLYCSRKEWKTSKFCNPKCYFKSRKTAYLGKNNPNFKGGINFDGRYYRINVINHPNADKWGRIYYHRYIVEQKLGRYLKPKEAVHHINRNKTDNKIENLYLFKSHSEHMRFGKGIDKSNLL